MIKHTYNELILNNREWAEKRLKGDKDYFKKLSEGQDPQYLIIGCSDSRVSITSLINAEPGELFVHRNIANRVSLIDINLLSVIEYSLEVLHIQDIIILGHYKCGGIKAAVEGSDLYMVHNWINPIRDIYINHRDELDKYDSNEKKYDRLAELNVIAQAENITKTRSMKKAFERKQYPALHGWIFDIYTGLIKEIPLPLKSWEKKGLVPAGYGE